MIEQLSDTGIAVAVLLSSLMFLVGVIVGGRGRGSGRSNDRNRDRGAVRVKANGVNPQRATEAAASEALAARILDAVKGGLESGKVRVALLSELCPGGEVAVTGSGALVCVSGSRARPLEERVDEIVVEEVGGGGGPG